jgi:hypothetical protein
MADVRTFLRQLLADLDRARGKDDEGPYGEVAGTRNWMPD